MSFEKAIQYANDRYPVLFKDFEKITEEVRENFVWIKKSTDIEISKKLFENLNQNIEKGESFNEWLKNSNQTLEKIGLTEDSSYLETVYRTNTMSFYNAGHYESQINNPEQPYLLYNGILDGREQEHTKLYDGNVYKANDPIWNTIYPPNGYNCRCNVIALSEEDIKIQNLKINTSNKIDVNTAKKELKDFSGNPSKNYWENLEKKVESKEKELKKEIKKIEFRKINKTKDLEQYVKENNLADYSNFKGINIEYAKEWVKGVEENIKKIPELRKNMKFIGSCQERNNRYVDIIFEKEFNNYKELYIKMGYNEDEAKQLFRKKIKKKIGSINSSTLAQSLSHEEIGGITLNKQIFNGKTNLSFLKRDVETKFHPVGCDTIKSIVDHEIGHEIDNLLEISKLKEVRGLFDSLSEEELTEKLSKYSWKNSNRDKVREFVAEAWSEYMNNTSCRPLAKKIGKIIEKRYEEWKK